MPKVIVVYGLMEFTDGVWAVYVPDAGGAIGRGATRELAILDVEMKLQPWLLKIRRANRKLIIRTEAQFLLDDAVKDAIGLGMELVAIRL